MKNRITNYNDYPQFKTYNGSDISFSKILIYYKNLLSKDTQTSIFYAVIVSGCPEYHQVLMHLPPINDDLSKNGMTDPCLCAFPGIFSVFSMRKGN